MEKILEKIAKQLNAYDEASLIGLWNKYAEEVSNFTPSKKWEESAIILCLIQAVHWKNQLFNYSLSMEQKPFVKGPEPTVPSFNRGEEHVEEESLDTPKKAVVLNFPVKNPKSPKSES